MRLIRSGTALLALAAALTFAGCRTHPPAPPDTGESAAVTSSTTATSADTKAGGAPAAGTSGVASASFRASIGFRTRDRLREHYRKHGREFGHITQSQYLALAQALRDRPTGGDVLELRRGDGVVTRFDRASGAFIAFDPDGTIRTFFRPNDGEAYFRRQARRAAEP